MARQFLVALVGAVAWQEERLRVGGVDEHRHLQRAAGLPHRGEACVVHGHQLALVDAFAQIQAQRLQKLQACRAHAMRMFDRLGLQPRVVRFVEQRERRLRHGAEAAGRHGVEARDGLLQPAAGAAGEVDHGADALAVHQRQQLGRIGEVTHGFAQRHAAARFAHPAQVRMHVDHRECGLFHARGGHVQHAAWLEVAEAKVLALRRHRRLQRVLAAAAGQHRRRAAAAAGARGGEDAAALGVEAPAVAWGRAQHRHVLRQRG